MGPGEVVIISQRVSIHATTFQRVGEGMECNPVTSCNHIYHTIIEVVLSSFFILDTSCRNHGEMCKDMFLVSFGCNTFFSLRKKKQMPQYTI